MTAKEYFERIKSIKIGIAKLEQRIREETDDLTAIGGFDYSRPVVQSSPRNAMEEKVLRLHTSIEKLVDLKNEWIKEYEAAERQLRKLSKAEYGQVIRLRYLTKIRRPKWGWVAEEMEISEVYARKIHQKALEEFEKKFL